MGGPMATHGRPRPLHRPSRRVARLSLSLSRGRPTAPYEGEDPYLEIGCTGPCEGETLFPEVANPTGPRVSPLKGRPRGVLRRRESAIPPSVDRFSRWGRTSFPDRPPAPSGKQEQTRRERGRCHRAWRDPWRTRPLRRLARPPRSLPASKTLSVSPYEGETLLPEVANHTGPCVSPLHRGDQEGSCGARSLRFPRRLTDPRGEGERRSPAGPPSFRNAGTQESRNRRGGNKAAVTADGGTHGDPRLLRGGPRPFHRPLRRLARPSLSLSRGRPTAP